MRLRIHRGAHEVGGSCVELEAQGYSILLDLGLPLDAPEPDPSLLPEVGGLTDGSNSRLLGVVISHPHGDHYGLVGLVHSTVPIFIGSRARIVLMASGPFLRLPLTAETLQTYTDGVAFELGPFRITPFLTDHSAFDAYSLLVEADGRRVFYSGDLRAHGRKARLVEDLLRNPPPEIDTLLLEGTTLSRMERFGTASQTEWALEGEVLDIVKDAPRLVLAAFSPQNIDRFVTIYRATQRAGRGFIGDVYLAHLLRELNLETLPQASTGSLRVYLPSRQRSRIIADRSFDLLKGLGAARIYPEEIASAPEKWVMLFRGSMMGDIARLPPGTASTLVYSLWPGYLDKGDDEVRAWCHAKVMDLKLAHTSGHADPQLLVRFAKAMDAKCVIPIHTESPNVMKDLIPNVVVISDGDWMSI